MAESIEKTVAEKTLLSSFRERCSKNDEISKAVKTVLNGNHKTYKYILVNAILAKASNDKIDPLALRAKIESCVELSRSRADRLKKKQIIFGFE